VFFRLRLLRPGDRVYVRQAGGTLAVFRVYAEHSYPKDHFPTEKVYGPAPRHRAAPHHLRRDVQPGDRLVPEQRRRLRRPDPLTGAGIPARPPVPARFRPRPGRRRYQPRSRHSATCGRSAPSVVSLAVAGV